MAERRLVGQRREMTYVILLVDVRLGGDEPRSVLAGLVRLRGVSCLEDADVDCVPRFGLGGCCRVPLLELPNPRRRLGRLGKRLCQASEWFEWLRASTAVSRTMCRVRPQPGR